MAGLKEDASIYIMYYAPNDFAIPIASQTIAGGSWEELAEQNPFSDIWRNNKKYSEWSYSYASNIPAINNSLEQGVLEYGVAGNSPDTWELRVYAKKEEMPVLTYDGLKILWEKISLEDYPNNDTLIAVLDAIDTTKANREDVNDKFNTLVGDTPVSTQISEAIVNKADTEHTHVLNDITDAPFEMSDGGGDTLTWDGNITGLETCDPLDEGILLYHISDVYPTYTDIERWCIVESSNKPTYGFNDQYVVPLDGMGTNGDCYALFVGEAYSEEVLIAAFSQDEPTLGAKKGIYVSADHSTFGCFISLQIPGFTGFPSVKLKTEYVPELITIDDIDAICGTTIQVASDSGVTF